MTCITGLQPDFNDMFYITVNFYTKLSLKKNFLFVFYFGGGGWLIIKTAKSFCDEILHVQ
jgi:hypothetical protein